jgi:hypothetical protein
VKDVLQENKNDNAQNILHNLKALFKRFEKK